MTLFSFDFIIFFGIVFFIYYAIPLKYRYLVLLIASFAFYMLCSIKGTMILIGVILVTYISGRLMSKFRLPALIFGMLGTVGLLSLYKFGPAIINALRNENGYNIASGLIAPLGLSFFSLQAAGYVLDVYKGKTKPEINILKYALFISFFPTVVSGPIERSTTLLNQIKNGTCFDDNKTKVGLVYMLWGYMLKLLIANRLAIIVNSALSDIELRTGTTIIIAILLFSFQLYADFSGYSYIALGMGKVLGFDLINNFRQPFLSKSVREFWSRWHISLSSFLRDYVYIPLGGSRRGKVRVWINLVLTFIVSGLWHGTGWQFVIWGLLHGLLQVLGRCFDKGAVPVQNFDGNTHSKAHNDVHSNAHSDVLGNAHSNAHSDALSNARSDALGDVHSNAHGNARSDVRSDAHGDARSNARSDALSNVHSPKVVLSEAISEHKAFTKSGAGTVAIVFRIVLTFVLTNSLWLFFRAGSLSEAMLMLKQIAFNLQLSSTFSSMSFLMDYSRLRFLLLLLEIVVLIVVDILHENNIRIMDILNNHSRVLRWSVYIIMIVALITGILYDFGMDTGAFIYAQF